MRHARQDLAITVSDVFVRVDTVAINVKQVRKSERFFEIIFSYYSLLCKVKYSITINCRVRERTYSRYL